MADKQVTGRAALTDEQRAKLDALRELHAHSHDTVDKIKLRTIDKFERQAGMTVIQRVEDEAKDDYAYKGSGLNQMFSTIKRIVGYKGSILIEVDEAKSAEKAKLQAFQNLGPFATPEEIFKYVEDHTDHTVMLTIPRFIKNLRNFVAYVAGHPERFGKNTGGSAAREVMDEALGAIRDARAYLKQHKHELPEDWYNFFNGGDVQTTDKRKFIEYLGKDWETEVAKIGSAVDATNIMIKPLKH